MLFLTPNVLRDTTQFIRFVFSSECSKGIAFTGDVLLHKQTITTNLPGANQEELKISITQLLELLPEDTLIFPGHGSPWFVKDARVWWEKNSDNPPVYLE